MTTFSTFATATYANGNIVVVQSAENMIPGLPIVFAGNTFGNVTANATYYIGNIVFGYPTSNITLTSLPGGAIYSVADGSGSMVASFSQGGQQIIPTVPPGEPLNQAFDAINLNFDQIWAAGPVGTNIQIDENTIYTLNTNGNLVLNPNGIGNVIANAHVIPDRDRVRNLGAPALRWNTIYAQNIVGNITGNIGAGGANTQVQFNDNDLLSGTAGFTFDKTTNAATIAGTATTGNLLTPGIVSSQGGIYGDIYTTLIDSGDSSAILVVPDITIMSSLTVNQDLEVDSRISATGNITGSYFFGNGSQLTGITADNVNADDLVGNILSGNVLYSNLITVGNLVDLSVVGNTTTGNLTTAGAVSATGNVTGNYILGNGALLTGVITSVANINNGNSNVAISNPGSNITMGVGGTANVVVVSPTDVTITGNLTVTGNATLSGNILGDRIQNGNTQIDIQTTGGNANVTVGGVPNVTVFATTGVYVTGVNSVSGNVTGGNVLTGGVVSATGNVIGNYFIGNGSQLTGITADNVNADDLIGNTLSGNVLFSSLTSVGTLSDLSVAGNVTVGNILIPSTGNVLLGNVNINYLAEPVANSDAATKFYVDSVAANVLPIITNQTITPNGSANTFVLDQSTTAVGILVTINGITQTPTVDYTVTGNSITIGETPLNTDIIQVRYLSGTTTGGGGGTNYANANVVAYAESGWGGNIIPQGNLTYDLGNSTNRWNDLYLSGNTIYLDAATIGANGVDVAFSGSIILDNSDGVIGPVGDDLVISWDNEEIRVVSVQGSIEMQADNAFRVQTNYDGANAVYSSRWEFNQDEIVNITGNSSIVTEDGDLNLQGGRNTLSSGNVTVTAIDNGNAINTWTFANSGNLTTPGGMTINGNINTLGTQTALLQAADDLPLSFISSGANGTVTSFWAEDFANLMSSNIAAIYTPLQNTQTVRIVTGSNGGNIAIYDFDKDGMFTAAAVCATGNVYAGNVSASGNVTSGNVLTGGLISATGNVTGGNLSVTGNVTGNTAGFAIGYRDIPQISFTGNATIATTDAGKHFYSTQSTGYTLTIANNASQGFQVGAAITVVNQGTGNITIAQGPGVTLYLAGNATSGNRIVTTFGMATIIKVATDTWFINGTGVS